LATTGALPFAHVPGLWQAGGPRHLSCLEWFRAKDIAAIAWDMMDGRPSGHPGFGMSPHLAIPFLGLALVDNTDPHPLAIF